ncbi:hypothetical protein [Polaromonas sp. YR568]|uniref:hypothetical protein n=1 Tax=Polaromonas sp. YR568 TaxID=1855301 RepID=UPI00398BEE03
MNKTVLNTARRRLLHLLAAISTGTALTALAGVGLVAAFLHFFPGEVDDAGFGGAAAAGLLMITAWVGVPLFSAVAYWPLKSRFSQRSPDED